MTKKKKIVTSLVNINDNGNENVNRYINFNKNLLPLLVSEPTAFQHFSTVRKSFFNWMEVSDGVGLLVAMGMSIAVGNIN